VEDRRHKPSSGVHARSCGLVGKRDVFGTPAMRRALDLPSNRRKIKPIGNRQAGMAVAATATPPPGQCPACELPAILPRTPEKNPSADHCWATPDHDNPCSIGTGRTIPRQNQLAHLHTPCRRPTAFAGQTAATMVLRRGARRCVTAASADLLRSQAKAFRPRAINRARGPIDPWWPITLASPSKRHKPRFTGSASPRPIESPPWLKANLDSKLISPRQMPRQLLTSKTRGC